MVPYSPRPYYYLEAYDSTVARNTSSLSSMHMPSLADNRWLDLSIFPVADTSPPIPSSQWRHGTRHHPSTRHHHRRPCNVRRPMSAFSSSGCGTTSSRSGLSCSWRARLYVPILSLHLCSRTCATLPLMTRLALLRSALNQTARCSSSHGLRARG